MSATIKGVGEQNRHKEETIWPEEKNRGRLKVGKEQQAKFEGKLGVARG